LLPALHIYNGKQLAQLTSTAAPIITTATGRTFITYQSSKRRVLNDRVHASACSLAGSSHSTGRAFTTTTAWIIALSSSLTDECLLASTWDYAGTTWHATSRRRTPTTNFQHLWRQHRSTARGISPRRHCFNILRPACRTTSTVGFPFFTPPSLPPSSPSLSTRNTRPGHHVHFSAGFQPKQQSPRGRDVGERPHSSFPPAPTQPGESRRSYTSRIIVTTPSDSSNSSRD
jgi:hypothetical protein